MPDGIGNDNPTLEIPDGWILVSVLQIFPSLPVALLQKHCVRLHMNIRYVPRTVNDNDRSRYRRAGMVKPRAALVCPSHGA